FGPVNSRRLGRSLGIDLIPTKICSFDCIYCEVGAKRLITGMRKEYAPLAALLAEVDLYLAQPNAADLFDLLTITASGEPTLHTGIGRLIEALKKRSDKPVAVLTNGSLLSDPEVRRDLAAADLVIPSLDAARKESYLRVNRPHHDFPIAPLIEGLARFSREYHGRLWLEILLVKGINDQPEDIAALKAAIERIRPQKIQLNTVVRPPLEHSALPLTEEELHAIAGQLGPSAEVIASFRGEGRKDFHPVDEEAIIALIQRRPCPLEDISAALHYQPELVDLALQRLCREKRVTRRLHNNIPYYQLCDPHQDRPN
ncbi:MAG: radical SAM protein, partial [Deltaproteobacteria bacterium]